HGGGRPPGPARRPLQPAKRQPFAATAFSVTVLPPAKECVHAPVQAMPPGELVTRPLPVSLTVMRSGTRTNVTAAVSAAEIVSAQPRVVPEHPPDHEPTGHPLGGTATTVTIVSLSSRRLWQPALQGSETVPAVAMIVPEPATPSVSGNWGMCWSHAESWTSHHEPE